jgi:hypothetical protein
MDDHDVLANITRLADEEHELESSKSGDQELDEKKLERLEAIRESLDQCWDLLRQRRARRDAGLDPDDASLRPSSVVERYEQ